MSDATNVALETACGVLAAHGMYGVADDLRKAFEATDARNAENERVIAERAWNRGYDACKTGLQRFRNPYRASPEPTGAES